MLLSTWFTQALAGRPGPDDLAACQAGATRGQVRVTSIAFQAMTEDDDYWQGYAAVTVSFKGVTIGHARRDGDEAIAFNQRVYPLRQAKTIGWALTEFRHQLRHGRIGVQPSDWYWLEGRHRFLCVVTGRSMERARPAIFLLSVGPHPQLYAAEGTAAGRR